MIVESSRPPAPITSDGPLPYKEAYELILHELHSDGAEVRAEYVKHFGEEIRAFTESMAKAVVSWRPLDTGVTDPEIAFVAALANAAITLHIESMKLFMDGHFIAAGNVFRQVVETIALTLLCSNRDLGFLKRFMKNQYSTNKAIRDLLKNQNWKALRLDRNALTQFQRSQDFYHQFSHPTFVTLASQISFSLDATYVGANFDDGKMEAYRSEIAARVGLARAFPNFVAGVSANVARWVTKAK